MIKFIKFSMDGRERYFNSANIVSVYADWDGDTIITTTGGYFHKVKEGLNAVLTMIESEEA